MYGRALEGSVLCVYLNATPHTSDEHRVSMGQHGSAIAQNSSHGVRCEGDGSRKNPRTHMLGLYTTWFDPIHLVSHSIHVTEYRAREVRGYVQGPHTV